MNHKLQGVILLSALTSYASAKQYHNRSLKGTNSGAIAGAIIAILFVLLVGGCVYFIIRRRRNRAKEFNWQKNDSSNFEYKSLLKNQTSLNPSENSKIKSTYINSTNIDSQEQRNGNGDYLKSNFKPYHLNSAYTYEGNKTNKDPALRIESGAYHLVPQGDNGDGTTIMPQKSNVFNFLNSGTLFVNQEKQKQSDEENSNSFMELGRFANQLLANNTPNLKKQNQDGYHVTSYTELSALQNLEKQQGGNQNKQGNTEDFKESLSVMKQKLEYLQSQRQALETKSQQYNSNQNVNNSYRDQKHLLLQGMGKLDSGHSTQIQQYNLNNKQQPQQYYDGSNGNRQNYQAPNYGQQNQGQQNNGFQPNVNQFNQQTPFSNLGSNQNKNQLTFSNESTGSQKFFNPQASNPNQNFNRSFSRQGSMSSQFFNQTNFNPQNPTQNQLQQQQQQQQQQYQQQQQQQQQQGYRAQQQQQPQQVQQQQQQQWMQQQQWQQHQQQITNQQQIKYQAMQLKQQVIQPKTAQNNQAQNVQKQQDKSVDNHPKNQQKSANMQGKQPTLINQNDLPQPFKQGSGKGAFFDGQNEKQSEINNSYSLKEIVSWIDERLDSQKREDGYHEQQIPDNTPPESQANSNENSSVNSTADQIRDSQKFREPGSLLYQTITEEDSPRTQKQQKQKQQQNSSVGRKQSDGQNNPSKKVEKQNSQGKSKMEKQTSNGSVGSKKSEVQKQDSKKLDKQSSVKSPEDNSDWRFSGGSQRQIQMPYSGAQQDNKGQDQKQRKPEQSPMGSRVSSMEGLQKKNDSRQSSLDNKNKEGMINPKDKPEVQNRKEGQPPQQQPQKLDKAPSRFNSTQNTNTTNSSVIETPTLDTDPFARLQKDSMYSNLDTVDLAPPPTLNSKTTIGDKNTSEFYKPSQNGFGLTIASQGGGTTVPNTQVSTMNTNTSVTNTGASTASNNEKKFFGRSFNDGGKSNTENKSAKNSDTFPQGFSAQKSGSQKLISPNQQKPGQIQQNAGMKMPDIHDPQSESVASLDFNNQKLPNEAKKNEDQFQIGNMPSAYVTTGSDSQPNSGSSSQNFKKEQKPQNMDMILPTATGSQVETTETDLHEVSFGPNLAINKKPQNQNQGNTDVFLNQQAQMQAQNQNQGQVRQSSGRTLHKQATNRVTNIDLQKDKEILKAIMNERRQSDLHEDDQDDVSSKIENKQNLHSNFSDLGSQGSSDLSNMFQRISNKEQANANASAEKKVQGDKVLRDRNQGANGKTKQQQQEEMEFEMPSKVKVQKSKSQKNIQELSKDNGLGLLGMLGEDKNGRMEPGTPHSHGSGHMTPVVTPPSFSQAGGYGSKGLEVTGEHKLQSIYLADPFNDPVNGSINRSQSSMDYSTREPRSTNFARPHDISMDNEPQSFQEGGVRKSKVSFGRDKSSESSISNALSLKNPSELDTFKRKMMKQKSVVLPSMEEDKEKSFSGSGGSSSRQSKGLRKMMTFNKKRSSEGK